MCAQFGDDDCWAVYDQIIALCPECALMIRATFTGDRKLHQEDTQYLKTVLERVQSGWRPPYPQAPEGQDDRDLTPWLFDELQKGRGNPDILFIKDLLTKGYPLAPVFTTIRTYIAGQYWTALVKDEARYDFKHEIERKLGRTVLFRGNDDSLLWIENSVPGNIFFGYMSNYIGFPNYLTHAGASKAQLEDHFKDEKSVCELIPTIPTFLDDPDDFAAIRFGMNLQRKYGASLTLFQLKDELAQNHHKFAQPPELPGTGSTPGYGWVNPEGGWPYEAGDFNGPRAEEFWPPKN
jgi:hypothetical protein